ncbi:hypothetical protein PMZ80_007631 [Knufia obscura]|uniref:Uncharacterized protein n=1 Tax=Knufia obscura TaxID=1635080 RepID=A0ABR0RHU7_9EURO|nr:hypothetical protein PMZ80_007631 [Knufia obscura]
MSQSTNIDLSNYSGTNFNFGGFNGVFLGNTQGNALPSQSLPQLPLPVPWSYYVNSSDPFDHSEPDNEIVKAWVNATPPQHLDSAGALVILVKNSFSHHNFHRVKKTGFRVSKSTMASSAPYFRSATTQQWNKNGDLELCLILHGRHSELSLDTAFWFPSVINLAFFYQCPGECIFIVGSFLNAYPGSADRRSYLARIGLSIGDVIAIATMMKQKKLFWCATSEAIHNYTRDELVKMTSPHLVEYIDSSIKGAISNFILRKMSALHAAAERPSLLQTRAASPTVCTAVLSRKGYYAVGLEGVGITAKATLNGPLRSKEVLNRILNASDASAKLGKKCKGAQGRQCAGCQFSFYGAITGTIRETAGENRPHGLCMLCVTVDSHAEVVVKCDKHGVSERSMKAI